MSNTWFKKCGWFYVPASWQAVIVVLLALIFCTTVFTAIDRHSHSVSDTFYGIFPYYTCVFLLLNWIGSNTSSTSLRG